MGNEVDLGKNRVISVFFDGRPIREPLSGVARYCVSLSKSLNEIDDLQVTVLVQNWRGSNKYIKEIIKLSKFEFTKFNPKIFNVLMELFPSKLSFLLGKAKCDVVHETYFSGLGTKKGRKKVVTIHDLIPIEYPDYYNKKIRLVTKRNLLRQCREADHIICVSEFTKMKVLEYCPSVRDISVIPCGVEPYKGVVDCEVLKKLSLERKEYIFYIGNIEPRKNLVKLAEAFKKIKKKNENIKFVLGGHLNYRAEDIIETIKGILYDDFLFIGKISEKDKWALLENAKLFVLPSLYEGFGIPIIEAYYAKCPAVFSNTSSMKELAVCEQQLFDPESVDDMSNCLRLFLDDNDLRENAVKAANVFVQRFNWAGVAKKVANVYRDVLSQ